MTRWLLILACLLLPGGCLLLAAKAIHAWRCGLLRGVADFVPAKN